MEFVPVTYRVSAIIYTVIIATRDFGDNKKKGKFHFNLI